MQPVVEVAAIETGAVVASAAEVGNGCDRVGGDRRGEQLAGFVAVGGGELDGPVELGDHVGVGSHEEAVDGVVGQDAGLRPAVIVSLGGLQRPVHHVDVEVQVADDRAGAGNDGDGADPKW